RHRGQIGRGLAQRFATRWLIESWPALDHAARIEGGLSQHALQLLVRRGEHVLCERLVEVLLLSWGEPALPVVLHPAVGTPVPVLLLEAGREVPAALDAPSPDTPVPVRGDFRHHCFPFRRPHEGARSPPD